MDQCGLVSIGKAESKGETGERNITLVDCTKKAFNCQACRVVVKEMGWSYSKCKVSFITL